MTELKARKEMEAERLVGTASLQFAARSRGEEEQLCCRHAAVAAAGGAAVISHLATELDLLHQYGPRTVTGKREKH